MSTERRDFTSGAAAILAPIQQVGRWLSTFAALLAFIAAPAAAAPGDDIRSRIDDYVSAHIRETGVPGTAIAFIQGAQVVHVQGYGKDSTGAPVTGRTLFYAGSLSKSMTALAVMQLVESGRIALDEPVHDYLPEFKLADPRSAEITVRQLLGQTSGMADARFFEWTAPGPQSLKDAIARMRGASLRDAPGTRFHYHNPNYHVAARLVEVVSGEPFADYMDRHVFKPIGMTSTRTIDRADPARDGVSRGHVFAFGQALAVSQPAYFLNGAAGVVTNAEDLSLWLITQANGGVGPNGARILSSDGITATHAPSAPRQFYTLGWMTTGGEADRSFSHNGLVPTYTAHQAIYPADASGIAVLSNVGMVDGAMSGGPAAILNAIHRLTKGESVTASTQRTGLFVDAIAALLAVGAVVFGTRAAKRNFNRAAPTDAKALLGALLVLGLRSGLIVAILAVPKLVSLVLDRAASWLWLLFLEPVLVVVLAAVGGIQILLIISRLVSMARSFNRANGGVR